MIKLSVENHRSILIRFYKTNVPFFVDFHHPLKNGGSYEPRPF